MTSTKKVAWPSLLPGARVRKSSGKPFKSGNKINTVAGYCTHPTLKIPCYTFTEDESYVECWRCEPIEEINVMNTEQLRKIVKIIATGAARTALCDISDNLYGPSPPSDILGDDDLEELYYEVYQEVYRANSVDTRSNVV